MDDTINHIYTYPALYHINASLTQKILNWTPEAEKKVLVIDVLERCELDVLNIVQMLNQN